MASVNPGADEPLVEITVELTAREYPFVDVSAAESCTFEMVEILPQRDEQVTEVFDVEGAAAETVEARLEEHEQVDSSLLASYDDGGVFEFTTDRRCPAVGLADRGAIPTAVESEDGTGEIVAQVPACYDTSEIVEDFLDEHPSATLATKETRDYSTPLLTCTELRAAVEERLTPRQWEVLSTAYEAGYYERPRETTGEEVASQLGISIATFTQHIRTAERHLLAMLFDD